jgi:hypothetical protein
MRIFDCFLKTEKKAKPLNNNDYADLLVRKCIPERYLSNLEALEPTIYIDKYILHNNMRYKISMYRSGIALSSSHFVINVVEYKAIECKGEVNSLTRYLDGKEHCEFIADHYDEVVSALTEIGEKIKSRLDEKQRSEECYERCKKKLLDKIMNTELR